MRKTPKAILALLAVLALTAAACGGVAIEEDNIAGVEGISASAPVDLEGADRLLVIELTEFDITAESLVFTPGETVKFVVTNAGVVPHELRLSNDDRVAEHIEGGHDGHDEGEDGAMEGMEEAEDVVLLLEGGESGTLLFTFPDNDHDYTVAVCLIPGHYEAGMTTDISYGA